MVTGVLADVNIEGHVDYLMSLVRPDPWGDLWLELGLVYSTFEAIGLSRDASDADIWRRCQERRLVLITNNLNDDSDDSLESTIRICGKKDSLPVFTIAGTRWLVGFV